MKRMEGSATGLYTIGITALFMLGFLLLVIFGAQTYRNTVAGQTDNNERRATLSYLCSVIKTNDAGGAVSIREGDYGRMLVVRDGSGYALHIFCKEGKLYEEYGPEDRGIHLKDAQLIGETDTFEIREVGQGLLEVATDEGRSILHLTSEGGIIP